MPILFWQAKSWPWKVSLVEADKSSHCGRPACSNHWSEAMTVAVASVAF